MSESTKKSVTNFLEKHGFTYDDIFTDFKEMFPFVSTEDIEKNPWFLRQFARCYRIDNEEKEQFDETFVKTIIIDLERAYYNHYNIVPVIHPSAKDPNKICFTPTESHGFQDKAASTSFAKFLSKNADIFGYTSSRIKDIINTYNLYNGELVVKFAKTPEECAHVYAYGPRSCMTLPLCDYKKTTDYPAAAYGNEVIGLAYLIRREDPTRPIARTVINFVSKKYGKCYGDYNALVRHLDNLGYISGTPLKEAHLNLFWRSKDDYRVVAPYLDGPWCFLHLDKENNRLLTCDGQHCKHNKWKSTCAKARGTNGQISVRPEYDTFTCGHCGSEFEERISSLLYNYEGSSGPICDDCQEQHYKLGFVAEGGTALISIDKVVEYAGEYYHEDFLSHYNLVRLNDLIYSENEVAVDIIDDELKPITHMHEILGADGNLSYTETRPSLEDERFTKDEAFAHINEFERNQLTPTILGCYEFFAHLLIYKETATQFAKIDESGNITGYGYTVFPSLLVTDHQLKEFILRCDAVIVSKGENLNSKFVHKNNIAYFKKHNLAIKTASFSKQSYSEIGLKVPSDCRHVRLEAIPAITDGATP